LCSIEGGHATDEVALVHHVHPRLDTYSAYLDTRVVPQSGTHANAHDYPHSVTLVNNVTANLNHLGILGVLGE
jgi:hypothetical protein